jgi:hypothetical protein
MVGAAEEEPTAPLSPEQILVVEELAPDRFDLRHLGEESVATCVQQPPIPPPGTAEATDLFVGLQDHRDEFALGQAPCGGQPGGAGTDDHDLRLVAGRTAHGSTVVIASA